MHPKMKGSQYKQISFLIEEGFNLNLRIYKEEARKLTTVDKEFAHSIEVKGFFMTKTTIEPDTRPIYNFYGRQGTERSHYPKILKVTALKGALRILQSCYNKYPQPDYTNLKADYSDVYKANSKISITLYDIAMIILNQYKY